METMERIASALERIAAAVEGEMNWPAPRKSKLETVRVLSNGPADDPEGPIEELRAVVGSQMLSTIKQRAQRAWIATFGFELVKTEIPFAYQRWVSNSEREKMGRPQLFLSHWFKNAMKDREKEPKPNSTSGIPQWELEANKKAAEEREKIKPADPAKVRAMVKRITTGWE